jgi:hypothetical protein
MGLQLAEQTDDRLLFEIASIKWRYVEFSSIAPSGAPAGTFGKIFRRSPIAARVSLPFCTRNQCSCSRTSRAGGRRLSDVASRA